MNDDLQDILDRLARGELTTSDAFHRVRAVRSQEVGDFAVVDHERAERCGAPEVVFCAGKEPDQVTAITGEILEQSPRVLLTRAEPAHAAAVCSRWQKAVWHERARCVVIDPTPLPRAGLVAVVAAGTADLPVAEEATVTLGVLGAAVERFTDVGVAGLHRLLERLPEIRRACAVVAVAGMDGALPSVLAGLLERPVIAVPTSVGYGANLHGIAPLLTMVNSCAAGVAVVNIDNGFGAGYLAAQINRLAVGESGPPPSRDGNS